MCYLFKGDDAYLLWVVKYVAADKKLGVIAERSDYDGDALQRNVLKQPRPLESCRVTRFIQRRCSQRQVATQKNIKSTSTKNQTVKLSATSNNVYMLVGDVNCWSR